MLRFRRLHLRGRITVWLDPAYDLIYLAMQVCERRPGVPIRRASLWGRGALWGVQ